jgi:hypothetical protein
MMIRNCITVFLSCVLLFTSTGCPALQQRRQGVCYYGIKLSLPVLLDSTDLKSLFEDIAAELCVDVCSDCATRVPDDKGNIVNCANIDDIKRQTVIVTDFADIQTYKPEQSGILMGELMRAALNNVCCYKIIQAEFAKYFKLSETGLVVLTRNANEIKENEYLQSEVIVGTYNYLYDYNYMHRNKVVIFIRRIDQQTGKITRMVTRELDYFCYERLLKYTIK